MQQLTKGRKIYLHKKNKIQPSDDPQDKGKNTDASAYPRHLQAKKKMLFFRWLAK